MRSYDNSNPTRLYGDHGPGWVAVTVVQGYEDEDGQLVYHPVHHSSRVLMKID